MGKVFKKLNLDMFDPIGTILIYFNTFELFWTILDKFGQVWTSLDKFGQVWMSLD